MQNALTNKQPSSKHPPVCIAPPLGPALHVVCFPGIAKRILPLETQIIFECWWLNSLGIHSANVEYIIDTEPLILEGPFVVVNNEPFTVMADPNGPKGTYFGRLKFTANGADT